MMKISNLLKKNPFIFNGLKSVYINTSSYKNKIRRLDEINRLNLLEQNRFNSEIMKVIFNNNFMVHNGPFEGMKYIDKASGSALLPKILGSYEEPIQEWILQVIEKKYNTILDIGCAEGYYAVGFGMNMPETKIIAYDIDIEARTNAADLVKLNGLNNIEIKSECTLVELNVMSKENTLVFCDIEGHEHFLLDPIKAPNLKYVDLIIESHDCFVPNITEDLISRFYKTHIIKIIIDYPFRKNKYKTNQCSNEIFDEIISERRPSGMKFLYMESINGKL